MRKLAKEVLEEEIEKWSRMEISSIRLRLSEPAAYVTTIEGKPHQVEVSLLEDCEDYVHVGVAVDDQSILGFIKPKSSSFIVHKSGLVER